MSDLLEIRLLGGLTIRRGGEPVTGLASHKVEALLAYLACTRRAHPREVLATMFWDERPQARVMANLRVALASLRRHLAPHVNITRDTAAFDRASTYWLDVEAFSQGIDRAIGQQLHRTARQPGEGLTSDQAGWLAEAVALYQGDFLAGFYVRESRGFEEWALLERERLRRMALQALQELVAWHLTRGEFSATIEYATQLLGMDPLSEEGHRQLMLALLHSGERNAALEQYEICRRVLAEELGIEPSERTTALYERIRVAPTSLPHDFPAVEVPCPYKGLAAFEPEDAAHFFGREALVAEMTVRLADSRFLAVVGPSGSGKSSVVRAGLLPAIGQGALLDSQDWQTVILTPGPHPLAELAERLSTLNGFTPAELLKELKATESGLDLAVRRLLADQPGHVCLLLVVDQFEEVFALCRDEAERGRFIDALLHAVEVADSRTTIVPVIRAEFYGHCAGYPRLAARLQSAQVLVGPLSEEELGQVIEGPAEVVGLRLEPGLVEAIANDVAGEPGALPLLSHALLETWQRRRGRVMSLAGYAETGGVAGAIAQTADTVYRRLSPEAQAIARGIFLRLTEPGEAGAQDTRRRVSPAELVREPEETPAVEAVLKQLADARLITTGEDTVEVAHEVLIREWPLLRRWLEDDREGLRIHRHLTEAAGEWERWDRDQGELYRGAWLALATEWAEVHADALNPLERQFLATSQEAAQRRAAEREARRQRELEAVRRVAEAERRLAEVQARASTRLRRLAGALGMVFLLAVAAAAFAMNQQRGHRPRPTTWPPKWWCAARLRLRR